MGTLRDRSHFEALFITGYKPTQTDFADLFSSTLFYDDDFLAVQFDDGDLSGGKLTISHGFDTDDYILQVKDENGQEVVCEEEYIDSNTIKLVLGTISGTWKYLFIPKRK